MSDEKAIAKTAPKAVAKAEPSSKELAELQAFISQSGNDLSPEQVKLSWVYAEKRGLDIIAGQITPTVIRGKLTMITRIDGFRVIAERSGDYAGQDPIKYGTKQPDGKGGLEWAEATVYRHSWGERGLTVRAYWDEFAPDQGKDFIWRRMPHVMLGKVAEAHALRKAFPNDLSGMYSDDEMAQAGQAPVQRPSQDEFSGQLAQVAEAARTDTPVELGQASDNATPPEQPDSPPDHVEEEEEKARPKYPRRRGDLTDAEWAQRLRAAPAISAAQRQWLIDWDASQPQDEPAAPEPVSGVVVDSGAPELPDADVDPSRGGSTETEAAAVPFPELPEQPEQGDLTAQAATIFGNELPVMQGDEGSLVETDSAIVISTEQMVTGKGNKVFVCWVTIDKQTRMECVMAQQLADASGASEVAQGQVVRIKGTWTSVGERLVVLAMTLEGA